MTDLVKTLWDHVQVLLASFATRLAVDDPTLRHELGRTSNEAFSLRAYLALRKRADGGEVAVTIDVQSDGIRLVVVSDACTEDVTIIADGPSAAIPLVGNQTENEVALASWLRAFEQFLLDSEQPIRTATARLS